MSKDIAITGQDFKNYLGRVLDRGMWLLDAAEEQQVACISPMPEFIISTIHDIEFSPGDPDIPDEAGDEPPEHDNVVDIRGRHDSSL